MNYYEVLVAQEYTAAQSVFTYACDQDLVAMQYVIVPLQKKQATGIVVKKVSKPSFQTKQIVQAFSFGLLPSQQYVLRFLKDYYAATEAQALQLFLPSYLAQTAKLKQKEPPIDSPAATLPKLTKDQSLALELLNSYSQDTVVLHGDTGTGKTRLYIERATACLAQGKTVLILSPEIALVPQLYAVFTSIFGSNIVASYHSTHNRQLPCFPWKSFPGIEADPILPAGQKANPQNR
jgi:primosomal protein N' (replication factor Y)